MGEEPRLVWRTGDGGLASVLGDAAELERTVGWNQGDAQRYRRDIPVFGGTEAGDRGISGQVTGRKQIDSDTTEAPEEGAFFDALIQDTPRRYSARATTNDGAHRQSAEGEPAAPAVVKRGIEIDYHTEHKGRNDIESYTFAAPVVLNGKRGNEAVVVQRTNRNKPHAVRIVMPDGSGFDSDVNERNSPDTSERLPQRATVYGPEGTVSADSIHNSQEEVNSALPNLRFSQKADAEGGSAPGRIYDYSKPFAEQVDDWMAGRTPQYDTLLIGRTPLLYRQIGLSDVPMTIDQTHLDYMINGTKNADHHLGVALVRQLPELLEHPVAVIESATRPDDSVMAIVKGKVNGRQLVAAVRIGGNGVQNGAQIDSNHIVSAQGRGNAITKLLNDALQKELRGEVGVYYWNKNEALPLIVDSGVQFPGRLINDGLIHSIFDAASPVNRNYLEQTETRQFKRWFAAALSPLTSIAGLPEVNLQIRVHFRVRSVPGNAYFGLIRRQFCIKYCK